MKRTIKEIELYSEDETGLLYKDEKIRAPDGYEYVIILKRKSE